MTTTSSARNRADGRLLRAVRLRPGEVAGGGWPFTVPAVAQIAADGLELAAGVTFLVGENGSGKSTLVEGLAQAVGLSPEGGSRGARHSTRPTESRLGEMLVVERAAGGFGWSYFLRAETMHGLYSYLEDNPPAGRQEPRFHEMSHGESFLAFLAERFADIGFYLMDEPESALSFRSCLGLVALLDDLRRAGSQVVVATHSPLVLSLPGATILELGEWGVRPTTYDRVEVVRAWRNFLPAPDRYLRHLLDP